MAHSRRRLLHAGGIALLAGCGSVSVGESTDAGPQHTVSLDAIRVSPVEHALYEPSDDSLFGDPARTALAAIIPEGRHSTLGYVPISDGLYVERDSRYYETVRFVTDRRETQRTLVRAESVEDGDVPADAPNVESLPRPDARVVKILHSSLTTGRESVAGQLRQDGAYVLRRPAERSGPLASGELDDSVVRLTPDGSFAVRVRSTTERITEPVHTVTAVTVADTADQFREVVFATRIDATVSPEQLTPDQRSVLRRARRDRYTESGEVSPQLRGVLDAFGVDVDDGSTDGLVVYDEQLFRFVAFLDRQ